MFTTFTLLIAVGVGFRLTLSWALRRKFDLSLAVPQAVAGAFLILACLPSWLQPITLPLPVSFTLGALLPDFFVRRR
ncbi:hypothetical protein DSM110093_02812 [Sulfitobacter sp. DSM 110093]|nr:hypothetical protein DSM110093_02812 [Sulfitobacter sp. DSM 110093]